MWRALFLGWIAFALADVSKRQTGKGNSAVYRVSPDQYIIQSAERETQATPEYQSQSDLYIIRKPSIARPTYVNQTPKRSQGIQLSALQQLQIAQQHQQQHRIAEQQQSFVSQQQKPTQQPLSYSPGLSEAGFRPVYKTAPPQRTQPSVQYSDSAIVNTPTGSFEKELAALVAANRAQEEKRNVEPVQQHPVVSKRPPPPQQYLKEITRPTPRPIQQTTLSAGTVHYRPKNTAPQAPSTVYRYVYQPEQQQQQRHEVPVQQEPQYVKPHLQQYQSARPQLRDEETGPETPAHARTVTPAAPNGYTDGSASDGASRSAIYVSQGTLLRKLPYPGLGSTPSDADKTEAEAPRQYSPPLARVLPKHRPFTQEEFQQILQSGRYTATLVPSNNPNSPQQEYILHPAGVPRSAYANEKPESIPYLLPQGPQPPVKRRPVYDARQQ